VEVTLKKNYNKFNEEKILMDHHKIYTILAGVMIAITKEIVPP